MTRFRASIFFIFIIIFSCLHLESNAADVYFNDVYSVSSPSSPFAANSGPSFTLGSKISGRNFKFTNNSSNSFTASGNDVAGTFSYYNNSGVLVSINGTISRQDKSGSTTQSVYFWSLNGSLAYFFVIPGKEALYSNGSVFNTSSDPMGAALDGVVNVTPQIIVSATSLSPFVSCVGSVSDNQTFTVSGTNLPANLTIVPPNGFEVSEFSNSSYTTSTLTITPVSNTVTTTTIYVRLASSNPIGSYSNQFIISSSTNSNIAYTTVSGTVYGTPSLTIIETDVSGDASNDAIICNGGSVTLTASGTTSYLWSTNSTSSTITLSPSSTTTYTVTGTTGCSVTASITITVTNTAPVLTIISTETSGNANNDDIICIGGSVTLTASGTTSFLWSSGAATTSSITITPSSSTTYTVTGTTSGCSNTASKTITVNSLPNIGISGTTTNPELVSLTASGGSTYSWSDGSSTSTASNTFDASGLYSLSVTDANGCISSTQLNITVQQYGLSRTGEKTLDSTRQISSSGQIGSLNPISQDGKKREYKRKLKVGDSYGGGIVAYIFQSADAGYVAGQQHGLIVTTSLSGIANNIWGSVGQSVNGTSLEIGAGLANTVLINDALGSGTAASLARSFNGGGYNDWYLPSYKELLQIYYNRFVIEPPSAVNLKGGEAIWTSSTGFAPTTARSIWFGIDYNLIADIERDLVSDNDGRGRTYKVLPVRSF